MSENIVSGKDSEMGQPVHKLEQELEEARSLFRTVFDSGPYPMWISDDKGTCIKLNEAFRRIWGATDEALVGKYNMFDDPVVKEQGFVTVLESVFKEGRTVNLEIEYDAVRFNQLTGAKRNGKSVIEATISPVKNASGKVTNAIIQHKDLTERKLAEEERDQAVTQMEQFQKMEAIGLLAAGVAHEINQPLTYIKAILECTLHDVKQQKIDTGGLYEDCEEAVNQVNRISRIISHLRLFGRSDLMCLEDVQLDKVLDDALILVGQLLRTKGIRLLRDIPEKMPCLQCDSNRLEQVFINLFQNAIDALKHVKNGQIHISVVTLHDQLTIRFSDNGVGISPALQSNIFEPFVTSKEVGEGTGLGLSIVYGIIKEHGGDIQYQAQKQGSTFVIRLPLKFSTEEPVSQLS